MVPNSGRSLHGFLEACSCGGLSSPSRHTVASKTAGKARFVSNLLLFLRHVVSLHLKESALVRITFVWCVLHVGTAGLCVTVEVSVHVVEKPFSCHVWSVCQNIFTHSSVCRPKEEVDCMTKTSGSTTFFYLSTVCLEHEQDAPQRGGRATPEAEGMESARFSQKKKKKKNVSLEMHHFKKNLKKSSILQQQICQ